MRPVTLYRRILVNTTGLVPDRHTVTSLNPQMLTALADSTGLHVWIQCVHGVYLALLSLGAQITCSGPKLSHRKLRLESGALAG